MPPPPIKEGIVVDYPGTGPDHDGGRSHICIAITDPDTSGDILLVPVCSFKPRSDSTCVIMPNAGVPRIRHKSFAAYFAIKKVSATNLAKRIESGEVTFLAELDPAVYVPIKAGVLVSPDSIPRFIGYFKAAHGIP